MTNKTQIRTQRISLILALSVITYGAINTYLFTYHEINTMKVTTPVILGLVITILLCGLLHRFFYVWLTNNQIQLSFGRQSSPLPKSNDDAGRVCVDDTQNEQKHSFSNNYDAIQEDILKKEAERQIEIMRAIREYVTLKTSPYLSKEALATLIRNIEYMACNQPEFYKPLRSNINKPLKSPGLRHLAWNVGERLGVSLKKRAAFIKASFPHELENATHEYLKLNLRDNIPSQIPIDPPDKGDYRFHLDTDNDDSH